MPTIKLEPTTVTQGWLATIETPCRFATGRSIAEAVGRFVCRYPAVFDIRLEVVVPLLEPDTEDDHVAERIDAEPVFHSCNPDVTPCHYHAIGEC